MGVNTMKSYHKGLVPTLLRKLHKGGSHHISWTFFRCSAWNFVEAIFTNLGQKNADSART